MRKKNREITDKKEIEEFIASCRTCRLALTDGKEPYVVPVNFGYQEDTVYIHGAKEGKKLEMLRGNSRVCLEWDIEGDLQTDESQGCKWSMNFFSVIAWGNASLVEDSEEKRKGLDVIMAQFSGRKKWDYDSRVMEQTALIKIPLDRITAKKKD